ncbi:unnamed protein product [Gadus morhua 'NCC']
MTKRQQGANIPWFTGLTGYDRRGTDNPWRFNGSLPCDHSSPVRTAGPKGPGNRGPGASSEDKGAKEFRFQFSSTLDALSLFLIGSECCQVLLQHSRTAGPEVYPQEQVSVPPQPAAR